MAEELLTDDEIDTALAALQGWRRDGDALSKDVPVTPDSHEWLSEAVMNEADVLDHHPDIESTDSGIRFRLSTHSAGGVTARDVELAARIDQVLEGGARDRATPS
ncbi:4a-hydroxytetrahydrobiopterin dehydratase [Nonomuraea terrae]|uniref:4a-hydroxytetrahydrobiopterin dehydratase n=1 Tax=Nonomuraea terrae TaxID=2530383 RepID=UPI00378988FE